MWLPGFERWDLPGVPGWAYDESDDPKAVLHTTEGSSVEGAVAAYKPYPPHLVVDPVKRRKVQHIDLDRAAYALWNSDADDSRCIQVEIVGFASQSHLWSDDTLRWLGEELARPLHEYAGVPYVVVWKGFRRDGETGYALADAASPLRLTQYELDTFSGFLGHQHIPGDSHWDPGGLDVPKILAYARGATVEDDDMTTLYEKELPETNTVRWSPTAIPAVGASEPIPTKEGGAWLQLHCPNRPANIYALYFAFYNRPAELVLGPGKDPRTAGGEQISPAKLPPDTYEEGVSMWPLPEGCTGVSILYQSDVPISLLVTTTKKQVISK